MIIVYKLVPTHHVSAPLLVMHNIGVIPTIIKYENVMVNKNYPNK